MQQLQNVHWADVSGLGERSRRCFYWLPSFEAAGWLRVRAWVFDLRNSLPRARVSSYACGPRCDQVGQDQQAHFDKDEGRQQLPSRRKSPVASDC
jgi:hypothetical protein